MVSIIPTFTPEYAERASRRQHSEHPLIWTALDAVFDPEIPGLSIWDLGILQNISKTSDGWLIEITLTYSGCPAVNVIIEDIEEALLHTHETIIVKTILSPAWSTELISPAGKAQMRKIGIAPPLDSQLDEQSAIQCPICQSTNTVVVSQFGSTACKALYKCNDCLEPFDYFKAF